MTYRDLKKSIKLLKALDGEVSNIDILARGFEKKVKKKVRYYSCHDDANETSSSSLVGSETSMDKRKEHKFAIENWMLKEKASSLNAKPKDYKDSKLQDQLIEKNQLTSKRRKSFNLTMQNVAPATSELLKELQLKVAKVRSLEEAYRKQEKVIEKMEMLLRMQNQSKKKTTDNKRLTELEKENTVLRKRLMDMKVMVVNDEPSDQMITPIIEVKSSKNQLRVLESQSSIQELMELKAKYCDAEDKIKRLELQIADSRETWLNERAGLLALLSKNVPPKVKSSKSSKDGDDFYSKKHGRKHRACPGHSHHCRDRIDQLCREVCKERYEPWHCPICGLDCLPVQCNSCFPQIYQGSDNDFKMNQQQQQQPFMMNPRRFEQH